MGKNKKKRHARRRSPCLRANSPRGGVGELARRVKVAELARSSLSGGVEELACRVKVVPPLWSITTDDSLLTMTKGRLNLFFIPPSAVLSLCSGTC